jgi:predicted Zn-dependent protease
VAVRRAPLADLEARLALAEVVLESARRDEAVELFLHHDPELDLEYRPGDGTAAETSGEWTRAGVRVWVGGRCGVSGGTIHDAPGCLRLLDEARLLAAGPASIAGAMTTRVTVLAPPPAPPGGLSGERARRLAADLAARARAVDLRPEVVLVKQYASSSVLATTAGTRVCMWMPQEQALLRCSGGTGVVADSVAEQRVDGCLDVDPLLRRLAVAAEALAAAGDEPDSSLPLVLRPAVAGLLVNGLGALLRADAGGGRSGLIAALGRRAFPACLDLVDEPAPPGGMNQRELDDEGTPARRVHLIERGRVAALLHSVGTAAALDAEPNGRAIRFEAASPPVPWPLNVGVSPRNDAMPASRNDVVIALEGGQARPGTIALNAAGWVVRDDERVARIGPSTLDLAIVPAFRHLLAVGGDVEPIPLAWGSWSPSLAFGPEVLRDA